MRRSAPYGSKTSRSRRARLRGRRLRAMGAKLRADTAPAPGVAANIAVNAGRARGETAAPGVYGEYRRQRRSEGAETAASGVDRHDAVRASPPARSHRRPPLHRPAHVHAAAAPADDRGRGCRVRRHPDRRRGVVPFRRALRAGGGAERLDAAAALQPAPRRGRRRDAVDGRLRRRTDRPRLPRAEPRADRAVPGAAARGGCRPALRRRRPLDRARRAARGGAGARTARAGASRCPRRRLGAVLRGPLLPRHGVQARGRGGARGSAPLGAGRDARDALRPVRRARPGRAGLRRDPVVRARAAVAGRVRRARARAGG